MGRSFGQETEGCEKKHWNADGDPRDGVIMQQCTGKICKLHAQTTRQDEQRGQRTSVTVGKKREKKNNTGGPRDTRYLLYADSEIRGFLNLTVLWTNWIVFTYLKPPPTCKITLRLVMFWLAIRLTRKFEIRDILRPFSVPVNRVSRSLLVFQCYRL